jgi:predicted extracellular nuclease
MRLTANHSLLVAVAVACSSTSTTKIERPCTAEQPGCDASASGGAGGSAASAGDGSGGAGGSAAGTGSGGGTSGTAGTQGGDDAGSDASVSDDVPIQRIQDGTIGANAHVTLQKVFVTAAKQQASLAYSFFVQEPQGQTSDGHNYPEFAGVGAFISPSISTLLPAPGDCVDVSGTVSEFQLLTQVTVSSVTPASNCGSFPTPLSVPSSLANFADIATDADPAMTGDQAGALAERFEGVLVRISNVQAAVTQGGLFNIVEQANSSGPTLSVSDFYYAANLTAGDNYTSLSGILGQFGSYQLYPRSVADILR